MIIDFGSLYDRYAQDVYRFALYLCGDPAWAQDIAAETFVRAWVSASEIRTGTVKAYLFAIARNLYRAGFNQEKRQVALADELPDARPDPEAAAGLHLELQAVLQALQTLPEIDRAALLMHVQDEMPYAEIAIALDLSEVAVRVKVHRARVRLAQLRKVEGGQL